ncbi:hypothetical protein HDU99_003192 [Rhizoclosmatium hyalinum]|nr:hypothetical protein HDU99_003192 [Rhizoclosmatium hyalinum]
MESKTSVAGGKGSVRMTRSSGSIGSGSGVSVTRKSAFQYGNANSEALAAAAAGKGGGSGSDERGASIDMVPLLNGAGSTGSTGSKEAPPSRSRRFLKYIRLFARQSIGAKLAWIGVLVAGVMQLLGLAVFASAKRTAAKTDALTPVLVVFHFVVAMAFFVAAPMLLKRHVDWPRKHPHAHQSAALLSLDVLWAAIAAWAVSAVAPTFTSILAVAADPSLARTIATLAAASGIAFVAYVRFVGKRLVLASIADSTPYTSPAKKAVRRRSSGLSSNAPISIAAANPTEIWMKRIATSFESHLGVVGFIGSGWALTFLESFITPSKKSTSPSSASLAASLAALLPGDSAPVTPSNQFSSQYAILSLLFVILQAALFSTFIYWGAVGHGIRHLPPTTQHIRPLSRSNSASTLDASTSSSVQSTAVANQTPLNSTTQDELDETGSIASTSGYNTPTSVAATTEGEFTSSLLNSLLVVKKRSGSNSLRSQYSNASLRKQANMNQMEIIEAEQRSQKLILAGIWVIGCIGVGLLFAWCFVCTTACGRS